MLPRPYRSALFLLAGTLVLAASARAQVFTVGEKSATADLNLDYTPTRVELPTGKLGERGRRQLVRDFESEQGFAHRPLPLGSTVTLVANGHVTPTDEQYRQTIYQKGAAAGAGERVAVTGLNFKGNEIQIDLNGGPYPKHRFLSHVTFGAGDTALPISGTNNPYDQATGTRITLVFEGGIPDISAPEMKALLAPLVDFGVKTTEKAYADTLATPVKNAIASHEVLVGMNHRMVLASLGSPESKVRESNEAGKYEEWIYGHQPQTVQFVRFVGDRVTQVKVAALGKAMVTRTQDEMAGYLPPAPVEVIKIADGPAQPVEGHAKAAPPTLKLPTEAATPAEHTETAERKVQFPAEHAPKQAPVSTGEPASTDPAPAPASAPPPQQFVPASNR